MRKRTRTSIVYAPHYPRGGDPNKVFEFRRVARARKKALVMGEGSTIVFWQNLGNEGGYTEDIELEVVNGKFKKTKHEEYYLQRSREPIDTTT